MRKLENLLIIIVLIILFYSASKYGDASIDVHFHDTFYVINSAYIGGWFAVWLLIIFLLFKVVRRRHHYVSPLITLTYTTLTLLFFCVFLLLGLVNGASNGAGFSNADLDALIFRNKLRVVAAWCLLAVQVIFLTYFAVQLLKKRAVQR
ncbi:hypothetical protein [Longitalea luteola]|uniref:hypothetical protein n=1 Tax=Longitalea luteola TaxID=2812563 RepID=UPI001A971314|nr:hypothetical protein [Longitalea luteola]